MSCFFQKFKEKISKLLTRKLHYKYFYLVDSDQHFILWFSLLEQSTNLRSLQIIHFSCIAYTVKPVSGHLY